MITNNSSIYYVLLRSFYRRRDLTMSEPITWFTPPIIPDDATGVSGLIASIKASEVTYKDRCKMHALASEGVFMTPRSIGRILNRHPRTVERILLQPETPTRNHR